MRFVLSIVLVGVLIALGYGFYIKESGDPNGEIVIGIAVLILAFIWMPLFIFHRYKNKNLSDFKLRKFGNEEEKKEL